MGVTHKWLSDVKKTFFVCGLCLISLLVVRPIVSILDVGLNTVDLKDVSLEKYNFCRKISNNPKFTNRPVDFRVDMGSLFHKNRPLTLAYVIPVVPYSRSVVLTKKALDHEYLDVIVAHELGHIENGTGFSAYLGATLYKESEDQEAINFATELLGAKRVGQYFDAYNQVITPELKE